MYKVAELLGTTSQEVTALLKRDHGIEVKSASSTIEEVVARQFVDRLARQRNISLPSGDIFTETPVAKAGARKGAPAKKPEPPKPIAHPLPPPRLVKTVKPAPVAPPPTELEPEPVTAPEPAMAAAPPEVVAPEPPVVVAEAPPPPVFEPKIEPAPPPVVEPPAPVAEVPVAAAPLRKLSDARIRL